MFLLSTRSFCGWYVSHNARAERGRSFLWLAKDFACDNSRRRDRLDMGSQLHRFVGSPLSEHMFFRSANAWKRRLEAFEWTSPPVAQSFTWGRLRELVKYAAATVPYYADTLRAAGVDPDPDSLTPESFRRIPPLSKIMLKQHSPELLLSRQANRRDIDVRQTSGTTGMLLHLYRDLRQLPFNRGTIRWFAAWAGLKPGDTVLQFRRSAHVATDAAGMALDQWRPEGASAAHPGGQW